MKSTLETSRPRSFRPELAESLGTSTLTPGWDAGTERRIDDGRTLARNIGWFSIALGLAEVVAPERIGGYLGMKDRTPLIRAYGVREIVKGVGILSRRKTTGWMWGRVAGDALDLATLASGLRDNPRRGNVMKAMAAVAGVTALDVVCARQLAATSARAARQREVLN